MNLTGKTAVVTGGGRGIGLAYCQRMAADGANVVAVDVHDPSPALDALTGEGVKLGLTCDVSDPEQIADVRAQVLDRFERCDIMVNNAGTFPVTDLTRITLDVWRRVQATNVEPVLLFTQAFADGMRQAGWGRVVNTGSANTLLGGRDLAYMVSKGGVSRADPGAGQRARRQRHHRQRHSPERRGHRGLHRSHPLEWSKRRADIRPRLRRAIDQARLRAGRSGQHAQLSRFG